MWVVAGEYSANHGYKTGIPALEKDKFERMAQGIRAGGGLQLMSIHPGVHSSLPDFDTSSWLDFTILQSGHFRNAHEWKTREVYEFITFEYNHSPTRPTIDGEPNYEYIPDNWFGLSDATRAPINAADVRRKAYWSVFAGAFGHVYGSESLEVFHLQDDPNGLDYQMLIRSLIPNWPDALGAPGRCQMRHLRSLLESRPILGRIPDQGLIAFDVGVDLTHAQATRGADGSYAWVYIPDGREIIVNTAELKGRQLQASWYNPRDGGYTLIGQFPNTGTGSFDAPGEAKTGNDWILILNSITESG